MSFAPKYDNLVMQSFVYWLNNYILSEGAYTNVSSKAYRIPQNYSNYVTYAFPFNQLVSDFSISGAQIPTGIYINNSFITKGVSGLVDINYDYGQIYFSTAPANNANISGNYSFKDINVTIPAISDIKILFETKMENRPKTNINRPITGIKNDEFTYPAIFVKNMGGYNEPFEFGGVDLTSTNVACFIFANSSFLLDGITSHLKDAKYKLMPLFNTGDYPYNALGGFKSGTLFNYKAISNGKINSGNYVLIKDVVITDIARKHIFSEISNISPDVFVGIAEFELAKPRLT